MMNSLLDLCSQLKLYLLQFSSFYLLIICLLLHFQPKDIKTHTLLIIPIASKALAATADRLWVAQCFFYNVCTGQCKAVCSIKCVACRALCTKFRNSYFHARSSTVPHFHTACTRFPNSIMHSMAKVAALVNLPAGFNMCGKHFAQTAQ